MTYSEYIIERQDIGRIYKLNKLTDPKTFWADVRKLTHKTHSDHALNRWQALAEIRYEEIKNESI